MDKTTHKNTTSFTYITPKNEAAAFNGASPNQLGHVQAALVLTKLKSMTQITDKENDNSLYVWGKDGIKITL